MVQSWMTRISYLKLVNYFGHLIQQHFNLFDLTQEKTPCKKYEKLSLHNLTKTTTKLHIRRVEGKIKFRSALLGFHYKLKTKPLHRSPWDHNPFCPSDFDSPSQHPSPFPASRPFQRNPIIELTEPTAVPTVSTDSALNLVSRSLQLQFIPTRKPVRLQNQIFWAWRNHCFHKSSCWERK